MSYAKAVDLGESKKLVRTLSGTGVPASQQGYPQGYPQQTSSNDKGSAPPYQQNNYQQGQYNNPQNNYQQGYNNPQGGYPQQNPYYNQQAPAPAGYPVSIFV